MSNQDIELRVNEWFDRFERRAMVVINKMAALLTPPVSAMLMYKTMVMYWHIDDTTALLLACLATTAGTMFIAQQLLAHPIPVANRPLDMDAILSTTKKITHIHDFIPVNEAGVIVLFSHYAKEMGLAVSRIGSSYPDATIIRNGQEVRVEFEYKSANFKAHKHNPADCDLIICWEHNWPDCPLPVIELSTCRR